MPVSRGGPKSGLRASHSSRMKRVEVRERLGTHARHFNPNNPTGTQACSHKDIQGSLWGRWQPQFKETLIVLALTQLDPLSVSWHRWREVPMDPTLWVLDVSYLSSVPSQH